MSEKDDLAKEFDRILACTPRWCPFCGGTDKTNTGVHPYDWIERVRRAWWGGLVVCAMSMASLYRAGWKRW